MPTTRPATETSRGSGGFVVMAVILAPIPRRALGREVVQESVARDPVGVGFHAVRLVEEVLPAGPDVPRDAPGTDRDVVPAVGNCELAEIDVAGDDAGLVEEDVREAVVT